MNLNSILLYIICLIGIIIIGKIFIVPIKFIMKLLINSILGAILLYIVNIIGTACGFHIGINTATVLIVGILGIPGVILLILFSIFIL